MARMGRPTRTGEATSIVRVKMDPSERDILESTAAERGVSMSDILRAAPGAIAERDAMVRAAMAPAVGNFSRAEWTQILAVFGGYDPIMLGQCLSSDLAASDAVVDGVDPRELATKVALLHRSVVAAIELWCSNMWRYHAGDDSTVWDAEIERVAE